MTDPQIPTPAIPNPSPAGGSGGNRPSSRIHRPPAGFKNLAVTTIASALSRNDRVFPFLIVYTKNNGTTNSDFILVGEPGNENVDLGVGDSFLFKDTCPQDISCVSNSGTQRVFAIGFGDY